MAQLSRKTKYQELRDEIEKEAMATQTTSKSVKLSRVQNNSRLSHANISSYPHETKEVNSTPSNNEVMDQLLGEVKQYNIDNGNRYIDDTQINILKQLNPESIDARNQHIMPMDEEEELGSTMEMPRSSNFMSNNSSGIVDFMQNQKLTRINPVNTQPQPEIYNDFVKEPEKVEEEKEEKEEKIVLSNTDIRADENTDTDHLDLFEPGKYDSFELDEEEPSRKSKRKAKKEAKKQRKKAKKMEQEEYDDLPSSKLRMQSEDLESYDEPSSKSGTILNVILVILIIALIASIGVTVFFLYNMGF
ncbi:MAG: hypothetical protein PUH10_07925 [Erysipelotrichaceae bacterium]|uniref:hypothetical protein n=1 Tax=Floccifex sp. TaxID=2815810 RepID=UPI002A75CD6E|nr:hypothetical protein [Floccifex sp.]MDD7281896.1 hypothetical protein [Erysipelotrichaceae bacterium]MDY2958593.1 hypothetical protein [Floccifex sp.]